MPCPDRAQRLARGSGRLLCAARRLLLIAVALAPAGCIEYFDHLEPYVPVLGRLPAAGDRRVELHVFNAPRSLAVHDFKPAKLSEYIEGGLRTEFQRAGFRVEKGSAAQGGIKVDTYVDQFNLGRVGYDFGLPVVFFYYGSSSSVAIADIVVEVTLPDSGKRFRRRFVTSDRATAKEMAIFIVPIPMGGYDEAKLVSRVANKSFPAIVRSVAELAQRGGGG